MTTGTGKIANSKGLMRTGQDETMAEMKMQQIEPVVVTQIAPAKLTLAEVRAKLDGKSGKRYWKSLDELADTAEFNELMMEEFPRQSGSGEWVDAVSRRGFLKVMGASLALAGMAGCTKQPDEAIFPYVKQPEDLVLGKPMYFATAFPFPTGAIPVLVKSDSFRPIKVDGNPDHPMSKGKSDAFTQATLLDMYDPDRSQHPLHRGEVATWSEFQQEFIAAAKKTSGGEGIYFLSETITSPTLAAQWKEVQTAYPSAKLVQWEPVNQDSSRAASKAAFGSYTDAQYKLEEADVILSLDADFLGGIAHPGFLPLAAGYAERHKYEEGKTMNRLYVVESMPTVTGFKAEHRLALKPSDIEKVAVTLAGLAGSDTGPNWANGQWTASQDAFGKALWKDLIANKGKCVVIPGEQASPAVHAAAYKLNAALGAIGKTVIYTETVNPVPTEQVADLKALVGDIHAGKVKWLVMLGVNPLYSAPVDLEFRAAFDKVPNTVHLGSHVDETGSLSQWHINKAHYLEMWSDARAYDGTISIIQPMIAPMYGGKSSHDMLQTLLPDSQGSAYDAVIATAKTYIKGDLAAGWRKALHDGWVEGTAFAAKTAAPVSGTGAAVAAAPASSGLEISFKSDPSLYDGRFANVGWLQELPKQVTNLSWDNAALMSLATMESLQLEQSSPVKIEVNGREVIAPALMIPGHADGVVTVHLGFGRRVESGRVAAGVGFNSYLLRASGTPLYAGGAKLTKQEGIYDLCVTKLQSIEHRGKFAQHDLEKELSDTQGTFSLPGHEAMERGIIRYATVEEAKKTPDFAHEGSTLKETPEHENSFFPDAWDYKKVEVVGDGKKVLQNAWGMSIDLNSCIGCNACIVSCYAENNIPVVGREQVKVGRNMQWIRIDTYFEGDLHAPKAHFQPMACQHCENAGCEQVCRWVRRCIRPKASTRWFITAASGLVTARITARTRCAGSTSCCTRTTTQRA